MLGPENGDDGPPTRAEWAVVGLLVLLEVAWVVVVYGALRWL